MVRVRDVRSEASRSQAFAAESKLRENRVLTLSSGNRGGDPEKNAECPDAPPPQSLGHDDRCSHVHVILKMLLKNAVRCF